MERTKIFKKFPSGVLFRKVGQFREVSNPFSNKPLTYGSIQNLDLSGGGLQQTQDQFNDGCFTGPVQAHQTKSLIFINIQMKVFERMRDFRQEPKTRLISFGKTSYLNGTGWI